MSHKIQVAADAVCRYRKLGGEAYVFLLGFWTFPLPSRVLGTFHIVTRVLRGTFQGTCNPNMPGGTWLQGIHLWFPGRLKIDTVHFFFKPPSHIVSTIVCCILSKSVLKLKHLSQQCYRTCLWTEGETPKFSGCVGHYLFQSLREFKRLWG